MATYALYRHTIRAVVVGRHNEVKLFLRQIPEEDLANFNNFLMAAFYGAAILEFAYDRGDEAVNKFAKEMVEAHPDVDPPLEERYVEYCVLGIFGEHHLMESLEPRHLHRTQMLSIRLIATRHPKMRERVQGYLACAEQLARQWAAGEEPDVDFGWFDDVPDADPAA
ncbi:hypothetical protein FB566_5147 [Stackebrandtia endophytica]|uniref:Uncharacterized protein n=1 Tax=Stackebrandtia endophytica TaxID=1496996 RepID=A0A543B3X8_9ACTN|nr:hypothetical protein [Stackebrandtia endophytica]TQL79538.1 hypothetical protein FB566_5147 [Stackebrandtia endophytica]